MPPVGTELLLPDEVFLEVSCSLPADSSLEVLGGLLFEAATAAPCVITGRIVGSWGVLLPVVDEYGGMRFLDAGEGSSPACLHEGLLDSSWASVGVAA